MNNEFYVALVEAGVTEEKAREAARHVAQYDDTDIAEMEASLLLLKWLIGFNLALCATILWRVPTSG